MKRAMVSELKAKLSNYLAAVRKGETVVVCDRKTPIARLIPYETGPDALGIEEPSIPGSALLRRRPVRLRTQVDVVKLLQEDRDRR